MADTSSRCGSPTGQISRLKSERWMLSQEWDRNQFFIGETKQIEMQESWSSQRPDMRSGWRRWGAPVRSRSWVVLSLFMSISNKNMLQTNTCHYYHIWAPAFTRYNRGQFNEGKIMELHELGRNSKHFNSNNIISLMSQWSHISTCHTVDSCGCGLCPQHSQWQLFYEINSKYNLL